MISTFRLIIIYKCINRKPLIIIYLYHFLFFTLVAPEIQVPSQLYGVGPGKNVTISCNVQAYPTAINYWMKDDNEMLLSGYLIEGYLIFIKQ